MNRLEANVGLETNWKDRLRAAGALGAAIAGSMLALASSAEADTPRQPTGAPIVRQAHYIDFAVTGPEGQIVDVFEDYEVRGRELEQIQRDCSGTTLVERRLLIGNLGGVVKVIRRDRPNSKICADGDVTQADYPHIPVATGPVVVYRAPHTGSRIP